jgi:regulator of nucleoside diphosphate kinase
MNPRHGYARGKHEGKAELRPPILLTTVDRDKLRALIHELPASARSGAAEFLREEVERADVTAEDVSPTSVVRMGSDVKFVLHDDGRVHRVRLVFPDGASETRSISVLTSVGSALIGLGPGQSICWTGPDGEHGLTVLEVYGGDCVPSPHRRRG